MDKNIKLLSNSTINGIVQIFLSLFWVWHFSRLLYLYQFPNRLFYFKYPNWTLILFISFGLLGCLIGLSIFFRNRKVWIGYFLLTVLFITGLIIDFMVIS